MPCRRLAPRGLIVLFAAVCLGVAVNAADAQPAYRVVDLGPAANLGCGGPVVNASGQALAVFGGATRIETTVVSPDGSRVNVGSLFGHDTYGTAINPSGQVVGTSASDNLGSVSHAFIWSASTGMIDMMPAHRAFPCAINSAGDAVGGLTDTPGEHAFVYTHGVGYDLNTLSIQGGSAWSFYTNAVAIDDVGRIYGTGALATGFTHAFLMVPVSGTETNLLLEPGFGDYAPPTLGAPGWISDPIRQIAAKSETNQPHSGRQNGACWATTAADCGMYQEVTAGATGTYQLAIYANADRTGGYVGANVNGVNVAAMPVEVRGFGNYGTAYVMTFAATAGDVIRVWMYSPAAPGYVVIDDASLTVNR